MRIDIPRNGQGHMKCPFLSSLYNINHELKRYSDKYLLSVDDGFVLHIERKPTVNGDVFSKISSQKDINAVASQLPSGTILSIFPDALYGALKDYKKVLDYIEITNSGKMGIRIMDSDNAIYIGECFIKEHEEHQELQEKISKFLDFHSLVINGDANFVKLNEEQVDRIAEAIFKCIMGEFHIRLTKQLVPGVSNKMDVWLFLYEDRMIKTTSGELCPLYVKTEKSGIISMMIYNIIKY